MEVGVKIGVMCSCVFGFSCIEELVLKKLVVTAELM